MAGLDPTGSFVKKKANHIQTMINVMFSTSASHSPNLKGEM
jgi:hypothetical protein